jgi:hypothetical protein
MFGGESPELGFAVSKSRRTLKFAIELFLDPGDDRSRRSTHLAIALRAGVLGMCSGETTHS